MLSNSATVRPVCINTMYILYWHKQSQTLSLFLLAINLLITATVGPRLDNTYSTRYTVNPYPVDSTVCFADTYLLDGFFPVDSIIERYLGQLN